MTIAAGTAASNTYLVSSVKVGDIFNVTYPFGANDESLKVTVRNSAQERTVLVLDEDYRVVVEDGTNNVFGIIEILKDIDDLYKINIVRNIPISQEMDFSSQTIFSDTTEDALDKLTMIAQDNQFKKYCIHVPDDENVTDNSLEVPAKSDRAGKNAVWLDDGNLGAGDLDVVTKALRQAEGELADPSFVLTIVKRLGGILGFDNIQGSVKIRHIGDGLNDEENGDITLKKASETQLGGIKLGLLFTIDADGKVSVDFGHGLVNINNQLCAKAGKATSVDEQGINVNVDNTTISIHHSDPSGDDPGFLAANPATKNSLGVVQIGTNIDVTPEGKISVPNIPLQTGEGLEKNGGVVSVTRAKENQFGSVKIGGGFTTDTDDSLIPNCGNTLKVNENKKLDISFSHGEKFLYTNPDGISFNEYELFKDFFPTECCMCTTTNNQPTLYGHWTLYGTSSCTDPVTGNTHNLYFWRRDD